MRTSYYYNLRVKPTKSETVIRVLHNFFSVLSIIGLTVAVALIIDGLFFNGRGFINVLIWIMEV